MMLHALCLFVSLVLVVVQCQVLDFTRQLTPDNIYCGHLRCVANSSRTVTNLAIYDITEKDSPVELASISGFERKVIVNPSKAHVINATGIFSARSGGILNVRTLREADCMNGVFQCELDFVNINGQPDVIIEQLAPATEENATIVYSLAHIDAQLKKHMENTDKQLQAQKHDNEVLKKDNQALKTVLDSILMKVSRIDGIMNCTLDKDQQLGSSCYRSMPHKTPREKFILQGRFLALCDTETDGGGWVILQRRVRGDVDFYRGWDDYRKGFGTPETDFWIGNDIIHDLTSQGYNELRIDVIRKEIRLFALYTIFTVADESSAYAITIGGYSGNVYDSMSPHNGSKFSTFDRDNDLSSDNCAEVYHGAWWYNDCYKSNLNGAWAAADNTGIVWYPLKNVSYTEMKIRKIKR